LTKHLPIEELDALAGFSVAETRRFYRRVRWLRVQRDEAADQRAAGRARSRSRRETQNNRNYNDDRTFAQREGPLGLDDLRVDEIRGYFDEFGGSNCLSSWRICLLASERHSAGR